MKTTIRLHNKACKMLGVDPQKVRLVGPAEFKQIVGRGAAGYEGMASRKHNVIYLYRYATLETALHELLHILFPKKPHWWFYCAGWKLTGLKAVAGKGFNYGYGRGFFVDSIRMKELPSKQKLIALAQKEAIKKDLTY